MTKQFNQQRNGRRTDPPDDLKRPQMQVFIATVEESSQQRQRTPRPLDQGGFGDCPDLRVFGHQAICPVLRLGMTRNGRNTEQREERSEKGEVRRKKGEARIQPEMESCSHF